jgi:hypothetical protein
MGDIYESHATTIANSYLICMTRTGVAGRLYCSVTIVLQRHVITLGDVSKAKG